KEQIYTHLYGYEDKGSPTAVAEHIKNIRAKLKDVGQNPIETVWGIGYKWH
ncbi:MAG: winged helix-turn-helix domain-containing protein, partial [Streptococcus salivarius]|nr:winged helix-turn-helix domain-containing protein [Streptococcus salivarius]